MTCHTEIQNSRSFLISDQFQCCIFSDVRSIHQLSVSQKHQSNCDILQIQKNMNQHMMTIHVDNYFSSIACQTSQFHEFNQFMNYVILIIQIQASCHTCSSDHEHTVQHIQHVYQIVASL